MFYAWVLEDLEAVSLDPEEERLTYYAFRAIIRLYFIIKITFH